MGLPTVTTLPLSIYSVAILAQERGIAPHSHLSPLPSLPNGEMLRELGGGSSGARPGCTSGCTCTSSIAAVAPGHCKRVVPDWHCHHPTCPGGGARPPVTLGVCYANVQGGRAGRTRSADRMRSRPCWLSRREWAPRPPQSVAAQISCLRAATLGAHWSMSWTLTRE